MGISPYILVSFKKPAADKSCSLLFGFGYLNIYKIRHFFIDRISFHLLIFVKIVIQLQERHPPYFQPLMYSKNMS